jgi:hypothetical protein
LSTIIFWGSLWGITEATLGHFLHAFTLGIGWFFWFPLAFFFIHKAFCHTGKLSTILYVSFLAACIKLIDLIMPIRLDFVINPAVSIVLEGFSLWVVYRIVQRRQIQFKLLQVLIASLSWRCLYIAYVLIIMPSQWVVISPASGLEPLIKFVFLESVVNTLVILPYLTMTNSKKTATRNLIPNPRIALVLLTLALIVQWMV